jgi:hypothetical protein
MGNEIQAISSIAAEARSIIMPLRLALSRALSHVDNGSQPGIELLRSIHLSLWCKSSDSGV